MSRATDRVKKRLEKKLQTKINRLAELKQSHQNATTPKSRSSFKGKITACRGDIRSIRAKIANLKDHSPRAK